MKVQLIEEWRESWRLWSVRLSAVGAALMGFFTVYPESFLYLWGVMPTEVRELLPRQVATAIAALIFLAAAFSRIVKQNGKTSG